MIPIPVIIGLTIVAIYLTVMTVKSLSKDKPEAKEQKPKPPTPATPPASPAPPKKSASAKGKVIWKLLWRLVILAVVVYGIRSCRSGCSQSQSAKIQAQEQKIAQLSYALAHAEEVELEKEYVASWACERGEMFDGVTESEPMRAEIVERSETKLSFNVFYEEYGSSEVSWVRLTRERGKKAWQGTWGQDNPPRHGQLTLTETGPETWNGIMTGVSGQKFLYTLEQKRK